MPNSAKKRFALSLHRFLQYWTTRAVKEQPHIHPTVYVMPSARITPEFEIGRYSYIREGARLESGRIGAFCSIAPDVSIGGDEHPLEAVSTHPFWYAPDGLTLPGGGPEGGPAWNQPKPPPVIGNDVWIGAGAQVLRGAVIEDGAVIGAGAIVTGRIPAYGIAVGIPAKVVRFRFDPETCLRLRDTQWWEWDEAELRSRKPSFGHADAFLRSFGKEGHAVRGEEDRATEQKGEAV